MGSHAIRDDQASPFPAPAPQAQAARTMADWIAEKSSHDTSPKPEPAMSPKPAEPTTSPIPAEPKPAAYYPVHADDVALDPPSSTSLITTDNPAVEFHAVAGIPTLANEITLNNESRTPLGVRVSIRGKHASMFTHDKQFGAFVQAAHTNPLPETVGVTYQPTAVGHHEATLVLATEAGARSVKLHGHAIESRPGGAASLREDSPDYDRELSLEAATHAARLAPEYTNAIVGADAARDAMAARILGAGTKLNARLVGWLQEEGTSAAYATEQESRGSNALDVTKFVLLEAAEMGLAAASASAPLSAAALIVVDLGWDLIETGMDNEGAAAQRQTTVSRLESVGSWAAGETTDVTRALVQRYSTLMSSYEKAKAELRAAADASSSMRTLHGMLSKDQNTAPITQSLVEHGEVFRTKHDRLLQIVRAIAAEGVQAESRASSAFTTLLDRYLRHRAGGDAHAPAHARAITTTGYIVPDAPRPIALTGTTIGSVDASQLGPSVADIATRRPLREMRDWRIAIKLSTPAGDIVLYQLEKGDRVQVIPDSVMPLVDKMGGIDALWTAVDRARVGQ